MTITASTRPLSHKHLIDAGLWDKVINQLVLSGSFTPGLAEETLNETLGYLLLCAAAPQEQHYPPPLISQVWRVFLSFTKGYALFCVMYANRFIHHEPPEQPQKASDHTQPVAAILKAMQRHHIVVDYPEIWYVGVAP
jgi:hypothetical protein